MHSLLISTSADDDWGDANAGWGAGRGASFGAGDGDGWASSCGNGYAATLVEFVPTRGAGALCDLPRVVATKDRQPCALD